MMIKTLKIVKSFVSTNSPWRAQVVITANENGKKRLCIAYSRNINCLHISLRYPLPRIDDQVNKMANFKILGTLDLKIAYHQIPLLAESNKIYTTFEANGKLYQFTRIPFCLTNTVAVF